MNVGAFSSEVVFVNVGTFSCGGVNVEAFSY